MKNHLYILLNILTSCALYGQKYTSIDTASLSYANPKCFVYQSIKAIKTNYNPNKLHYHLYFFFPEHHIYVFMNRHTTNVSLGWYGYTTNKQIRLNGLPSQDALRITQRSNYGSSDSIYVQATLNINKKLEAFWSFNFDLMGVGRTKAVKPVFFERFERKYIVSENSQISTLYALKKDKLMQSIMLSSSMNDLNIVVDSAYNYYQLEGNICPDRYSNHIGLDLCSNLDRQFYIDYIYGDSITRRVGITDDTAYTYQRLSPEDLGESEKQIINMLPEFLETIYYNPGYWRLRRDIIINNVRALLRP